MDMPVACEAGVSSNVQFINETEDIVSSSACWDSSHDSGDTDDCGDNQNGVATAVDDDGMEDVHCVKRRPKPGKKTMGRVKIKMEYIKNKVRRYTTFSKRKTGIMKKVLVNNDKFRIRVICLTF
jgi:hypothetical protein